MYRPFDDPSASVLVRTNWATGKNFNFKECRVSEGRTYWECVSDLVIDSCRLSWLVCVPYLCEVMYGYFR